MTLSGSCLFFNVIFVNLLGRGRRLNIIISSSRRFLHTSFHIGVSFGFFLWVSQTTGLEVKGNMTIKTKTTYT